LQIPSSKSEKIRSHQMRFLHKRAIGEGNEDSNRGEKVNKKGNNEQMCEENGGFDLS
jgi:hypothetical protein